MALFLLLLLCCHPVFLSSFPSWLCQSNSTSKVENKRAAVAEARSEREKLMRKIEQDKRALDQLHEQLLECNARIANGEADLEYRSAKAEDRV